MPKLEEIQQAVKELPNRDLWELISWLDELAADRWDKQIERDAAAGRLDKLADKALLDYRAGRINS